MGEEEKKRLRAAFDAVTGGMDPAAINVLLKEAAADMPAALVEYEALARLCETHTFALAMRGGERAFITLPIKRDELGRVDPHMLSQAVIRI